MSDIKKVTGWKSSDGDHWRSKAEAQWRQRSLDFLYWYDSGRELEEGERDAEGVLCWLKRNRTEVAKALGLDMPVVTEVEIWQASDGKIFVYREDALDYQPSK